MTKYCVEIAPTVGNQSVIQASFDSALERALFLISWSRYCRVLKEWQEAR